MARHFLIDTDTASDDAVALIMAHRWPGVTVEAVTVVSGNVPLEQATRNALYTIELCGADTPVFSGADRPLRREASYARYYHGQDGLGDQGYPPPSRAAEPGHAVDAILETVARVPGITLVTLGPLTNIAMAISRDPETMASVGRCVVMGGAACTVGNVTPAAEFNIWVDPDAARVVFRSGMPIEMVGWELSRGDANVSPAEQQAIRGLGNPLADFAIDCNATVIVANQRETGGRGGIALPDPVAMAVALEPSVCTLRSEHFVEIEVDSDLTRGMTVVDEIGVAVRERNRDTWGHLVDSDRRVTVCWAINTSEFKRMLFQSLS